MANNERLQDELANLARRSWELYLNSKSITETSITEYEVKPSCALIHAVTEINERIDDLVGEYENLLRGNPKREEVGDEISRLRLLRKNLSETKP